MRKGTAPTCTGWVALQRPFFSKNRKAIADPDAYLNDVRAPAPTLERAQPCATDICPCSPRQVDRRCRRSLCHLPPFIVCKLLPMFVSSYTHALHATSHACYLDERPLHTMVASCLHPPCTDSMHLARPAGLHAPRSLAPPPLCSHERQHFRGRHLARAAEMRSS